MELDDFKTLENKPEHTHSRTTDDQHDTLEKLISEMKVKDQERKKVLLLMTIVFIPLGIIYFSSTTHAQGFARPGFFLLGGAFLLLVLFFLSKYLKQKNIDYTAPVSGFLKDAEKRYRYWTTADMFISIPMLIILCAGGGLVVHGSFQKYFPGSFIPLFIFLIIFATALGVGLLAGRKQWITNYRELYEKIRQMRQEFEEN